MPASAILADCLCSHTYSMFSWICWHIDGFIDSLALVCYHYHSCIDPVKPHYWWYWIRFRLIIDSFTLNSPLFACYTLFVKLIGSTLYTNHVLFSQDVFLYRFIAGCRLCSRWPYQLAIWTYIGTIWCNAGMFHLKLLIIFSLSIAGLNWLAHQLVSTPTSPMLKLADLRACSRQILLACCVWDTWSHFCVNKHTYMSLIVKHHSCW
jgi:hypothetical protein